MFKILTIAGSDCSGGAGIQADIKKITVHGMYAMSAITALTALNTTGVYGVLDASPQFMAQQLDCIFTDIPPDAVKIGMVSNNEIIDVIVSKLQEYKARNIVADPVMISTSGSPLLQKDAMETLTTKLLPMASILTPNIPEAEVLSEITICSKEDMQRAGFVIYKRIGQAVLLKGGHLSSSSDDLLIWNNPETKEIVDYEWFEGPRVNNPNTHGTGCTLSSAIACNIAAGHSMPVSIRLAKAYITKALAAGLNLGKGDGPLNHCVSIPYTQPTENIELEGNIKMSSEEVK